MEIGKEEIIKIQVEYPTYFTNAKQQEIGITVFSFIAVPLLLLAITITNKPENVARKKSIKRNRE